MGLILGPDITLPLDITGKKLAFLGTTGSGKTYAAQKLAEQLLLNHAQIVVLDPVGVWYGLRISKDGKGVGYQIPVFGGMHGDLPLEPGAGALVADIIVDRGISAVLDISQMDSDAEAGRFAAAFAARLFQRRKAKPAATFVFLEECQEFVPENPGGNEAQKLHSFTRLAKIGRNFGIGVAMISQRPQEVSKKTLNLSECVFAFQTNGKQERDAIKAWLRDSGAEEINVDDLPTLEVGQARVWSPRWLKTSRVVTIGRKQTFDASSTPDFTSSVSIQTKPLRHEDIVAISAAMADTIERAKAEDPKELRKQLQLAQSEIARMQRQSSSAAATVTTAVDPAQFEKAFERGAESVRKILARELDQFVKLYRQRIAIAEKAIRSVLDTSKAVTEVLDGEIEKFSGLTLPEFSSIDDVLTKTIEQKDDSLRLLSPRAREVVEDFDRTLEQDYRNHPSRDRVLRDRSSSNGNGELKAVHRALLTALAQHPNGLPKGLVVLHSGYAASGPVSTAFADFVRQQFTVTDGGLIRITDKGLNALGDYDPLPVGSGLYKYLLDSNRLNKVEKSLLSVLGQNYGRSVSKGEIVKASGYQPSGPVSSAFARLVRFGYAIKSGGGLMLSPELTDKGRK